MLQVKVAGGGASAGQSAVRLKSMYRFEGQTRLSLQRETRYRRET